MLSNLKLLLVTCMAAGVVQTIAFTQVPSREAISHAAREAAISDDEWRPRSAFQNRVYCMSSKIVRDFDSPEPDYPGGPYSPYAKEVIKAKAKGVTLGDLCRAFLEVSADVSFGAQHFWDPQKNERGDVDLLSPYRIILEVHQYDYPYEGKYQEQRNLYAKSFVGKIMDSVESGEKLSISRMVDASLDTATYFVSFEKKGEVQIVSKSIPTTDRMDAEIMFRIGYGKDFTVTPGLAYDVGFTQAMINYSLPKAPLPHFVNADWDDAKISRGTEACVRGVYPPRNPKAPPDPNWPTGSPMPSDLCFRFGYDAGVQYISSHPQNPRRPF